MMMVERVAHALSEEADWDGVMPHRQARYRRQAWLAILAMREPTEEMMQDGRGMFADRVDINWAGDSDPARDIWQAMIDAATHHAVPATADPVGFDLPQGERE
jgi:hypothetical protein